MSDGCRARAKADFTALALGALGALGGSATLGLACSPAPPAQLPGSSSGPRPTGGGTPPAKPAPKVRWEAYERVIGWPPLGEPFPSAGHAPPRYLGSPRVPPASRDAYEALVPGATLPAGFVAAMVHTDRETDRPGPIYAAEKQSDGAWRYTVSTASGKLLDQGHLQGCARCHAEAPSDGLFGLPERHAE